MAPQKNGFHCKGMQEKYFHQKIMEKIQISSNYCVSKATFGKESRKKHDFWHRIMVKCYIQYRIMENETFGKKLC